MNDAPVPIEHPGYRGETEVRLHSQFGMNMRADFVGQLLKHLALVTGEADGEDSAGRQKLRLMTPIEVAKRACDIADAAWQEFNDRGWLVEMPLPKLAKLKDEL